MEASIFGKALDDVSYDDVVRFCEQEVKEGLNLDYKLNLSTIESVVKTLVSFANTSGGWIVVGVEDDNDMPKEPYEGMAYEDNFIERINSSIIASVSPAVLPFYKIAVSDNGDKAFVIVYMPQSPSAPHWFNYKKKRNALLIRIADRTGSSDWEEDAPDAVWERLRNNREKAIAFSDQLISLQDDVFDRKAYLEDERVDKESPSSFPNLAISPFTPTKRNYYAGTQSIIIAPSYPSE